MSNESENFEDTRNALVGFIEEVLLQSPLGVKEYQLIDALGRRGAFDAFAGQSASLQLFAKHFLTMHALYYLRQELPLGQTLEIDPLLIRLHPSQSSQTSSGRSLSKAGQAKLAAYYLDLNNLHSATEESVDELLTSFWRRYNSWLSNDEPFDILGLDEQACWSDVQKAYRKKVQAEHPDKGGDAEQFAQYVEAYQVLKKRFLK